MSPAEVRRERARDAARALGDPEEAPPDFGERLAIARRFRNLTQAALAEAADLHPRHLSRLEERLEYPRLPTVRRLAEALDVSAFWLLTGSRLHGRCPACGKPQ